MRRASKLSPTSTSRSPAFHRTVPVLVTADALATSVSASARVSVLENLLSISTGAQYVPAAPVQYWLAEPLKGSTQTEGLGSSGPLEEMTNTLPLASAE